MTSTNLHKDALDRLLARLVRGQKWLADASLSLEEGSVGADAQARFASALDHWYSLDLVLLRRVYSHAHCIHGEGRSCPSESPAKCRRCTR